MNNTTHRVGKDILSLCTKCKLTLGHIIVSMVDATTVSKVKCNTCQSVHRFKDPTTSKLTRKKLPNLLKKQTPSIHNIWEEAMKKPQDSRKPYSFKEKFVQGDVIEHPTFGPGVVDSTLEKDKIRVIFQSNEKTLLHNKK